MEAMGVASGCGYKVVYRFLIIIYYRRPLFNCEILIIANCEVSHNSQLLETQ